MPIIQQEPVAGISTQLKRTNRYLGRSSVKRPPSVTKQETKRDKDQTLIISPRLKYPGFAFRIIILALLGNRCSSLRPWQASSETWLAAIIPVHNAPRSDEPRSRLISSVSLRMLHGLFFFNLFSYIFRAADGAWRKQPFVPGAGEPVIPMHACHTQPCPQTRPPGRF